MKKISAMLFFVSLLLMACHAYAGQNTLITNYPAPIGNYNNVQIITQKNPDCTQAINAGMVFTDAIPTDPTYGTLEICLNGQAAVYNQECFNRFCSGQGISCGGCPPGFTQMTLPNTGGTNVDTFQTDPTPTYVSSIACCTTNNQVEYQ